MCSIARRSAGEATRTSHWVRDWRSGTATIALENIYHYCQLREFKRKSHLNDMDEALHGLV